MPPASVEIYETDDTTLATGFAFGSLGANETSSTWTVHVWNANGSPSADEATDVTLDVTARISGTGDFESEVSIVSNRMFEARITGVVGTGIPQQSTGWREIGRGRALQLDNIPADTARVVELRMVTNASPPNLDWEIAFAANWDRTSTGQDQGHFYTGGNGVFTGAGDLRFTEIVWGGDLTETGTPDMNVQVADLAWKHRGIPYIKLAHAILYTAASTDNAYWSTLSVAAGTITVTNSSEEADPPSVDNRPAVPDGERLLGYVKVNDTSSILDADIDQSDRVFGLGYVSTSGLNATVHAVQAMVDGNLVIKRSTSLLTMLASSVNMIWLLPNGNVSTTLEASDPQDDRAIPLFKITTDGSGETAREDLRRWIGPPRQDLDFFIGGNLTTGDKAYGVLPRGGYLMLPHPVEFAVQDNGVTGQSRLDVQYSEAGGAWTTLFTGGTGDMPTIAHDAADPIDINGKPEILAIPFNSRLRINMDDVPSGTPSADAMVRVRIEDIPS